MGRYSLSNFTVFAAHLTCYEGNVSFSNQSIKIGLTRSTVPILAPIHVHVGRISTWYYCSHFSIVFVASVQVGLLKAGIGPAQLYSNNHWTGFRLCKYICQKRPNIVLHKIAYDFTPPKLHNTFESGVEKLASPRFLLSLQFFFF